MPGTDSPLTGRDGCKIPPAGLSVDVLIVQPRPAGGPLTQKEYNSRIVHSKHPRDIQVVPDGGQPYTLRYAYVCQVCRSDIGLWLWDSSPRLPSCLNRAPRAPAQRGYYPESPNKENQDSFIVIEDFTGSRQDHFFGVFDGATGGQPLQRALQWPKSEVCSRNRDPRLTRPVVPLVFRSWGLRSALLAVR